VPTNVSPEYKAAEAAFRRARDPVQRLEWLREMLRTIPKHKGTDHLQGDIKRRIKELSEELEGPRKGGAHGGPPQVIRPEGAAQLAMLGPPNAGKSSLHDRLTGSGAPAGPYPFTTQHPEPGMLPFEDIHFQLVDLPAVAREHAVPWLAGTLQTADACLLVVDLGDPACVEKVQEIHAILGEKRISLSERWDWDAADSEGDPFALRLPTLMLANKADRIAAIDIEHQAFVELTGLRYPWLALSAATGQGLGDLGPWLFRSLRVVRVYTKPPGKPPEKHRPFVLRLGQTVEDVARLVHRDIAHSLRYARVWGPTGIAGQQVGRDHRLADGEIVELHT
jgi:uncharacterized protein